MRPGAASIWVRAVVAFPLLARQLTRLHADYGLLKRRINEALAMRKRQNAKPEIVTAMTTVFQGPV